MTTAAESAGAPTQLAAGLALGVNTISYDQVVTFTKYVRLVLPLDGMVFWVRANLVSASALLNAAKFNFLPFNAATSIITTAATVEIEGSLHYATQRRQDEDEAYDVNAVRFTALSQIDIFNEIGPNVLFLGEFEGEQFAFSRRESFYEQANLFHYVGDAIYPALESQIINSIDQLNSRQLIISDSLPVWLTLNQFMPMYPSYLVPINLPPPYAAVHVSDTQAIGSAPAIDGNGSHFQLAKDNVKIIMYGLTNQQALDFQDYIFNYSLNYDVIGVMNVPIIRDEKRIQSEMAVIAMKKSFEIDVSYYQTRINDISRQFILSALITFDILPDPY